MSDLAALTAQAESGDAEAQFALAKIYQTGVGGVAANLPKAINWYFKAASQDHVAAQFNLGVLLLDDVTKAGAKRNPKQAFAWLTKAANAGNAVAQYRLGMMLLAGDGIDKDARAGIAWLERAALGNNADAQFALGYRLVTGQDVAQDTGRGHQCLLMAAKQDHGDALYHLGLLLEHGAGFDAPSVGLAARMYPRAVAKHGHRVAAHDLAILHAKGSGVERDMELAKELLEYSISLGEDRSMYDLGLVLMQNGPQQDLPAAVMWATLAVRQNPASAGAKLLQVLAGIATPEQIAEGEQRAGVWQRQPKGITIMTVGGGENEFQNLSFEHDKGA
ncbi:MAG: sel1 repeat family protein [Betaproteobacteria bacterium]|nr:sel1 repeat family protein [Betaproteobacteria bacterium]